MEINAISQERCTEIRIKFQYTPTFDVEPELKEFYIFVKEGVWMAKIKNEVDWKDLEDYFKWHKENLITATSWTNHDVPRAIDRYFKTDINNRFYAQTAMTTLLMTTKGIPFIYQGEEFGMSPLAINSYDDFVDRWTPGRSYRYQGIHWGR